MADTDSQKHLSVRKANQTIADKVNECLPVNLNGEDVEKTPEFVKLLKVLSQHINEEGVSKPVKQNMKETEKNLHREKKFWLQQNILKSEIEELLLDNQLAVQGAGRTSSNQEFYNVVHDCLISAEIINYLEPNPDNDSTLLGLQKSDVQRRNPNFKHLPEIQQRLIPEVEQRLRKRCEALVGYHESSSSTDSSDLTFAKSSQLPAFLEAEKQRLEEHRKQLKLDRAARQKQFLAYYKALMSSLEVLQKLIVKHRLRSQIECDNTTSEWLIARCDAMCLKIKVLELQVLCDTYYAETVQALKIIRKEVAAATEKTKNDISVASQSLKAYESVGHGFDALVREYTYIRDEVENKKWAIRELKPVPDREVNES